MAEAEAPDPIPPTPGLSPGTRVGPYRLVRRLGLGGMGEVLLAHDERLDRDVAIKFLSPLLAADADSRARFEREMRAVARLDHPNIVTVHEAGEHEGRPYLVMQRVDGPSLARLARERPLSPAVIADLGRQVCAGLQAAHERGIVHRDVKPSNILVDDRLRARLVDFGIAWVRGAAPLTRTGAVCGSLGYIPPETVRGEEADARSDVFSLGAVLYELLAGRPPFTTVTEAAYLHAVLNDEPAPLAGLRADAPAALVGAVTRALARDRARRQQSAAEFAAELEAGPTDSAAAPARERPSIAVLPFTDMSPAHDEEYFCDGLAEELINGLGRLKELRVIARASAFSFKGSQADAREIGRRLGVGVLLSGSVRKAGDRVRIAVQLVDAREGGHLWAETYDRDLHDVFAVQDEVCLGVARRLRGTLLGPKKAPRAGRATRATVGARVHIEYGNAPAPPPRRPTADTDAYTHYLRGLHLFNQRQETSVRRSRDYYRQAIGADPRFALAHAGLAKACEVLGSMRWMPAEEAYAEARRAARTAVELDDGLAEGHAALAAVRMWCDLDWVGAQREFERALTLNPGCAEAHHIYAHWHETNGGFDRAVAEMHQALELEPVVPGLHSCFAQVLFNARRYDEAIRESALALEMAPDFAGVLGWLGAAQLSSGREEAALRSLREGLGRRPGDPRLEALLGFACAKTGDTDGARAALARLDAAYAARYVDPYFRAWPLAALGETGPALASLERAVAERSQWHFVMAVDPLLDDLRPDPGFARVVARLGLPG